LSTQEFKSLVINNADSLTPFAITLTRDYESARDLCQETLCKAFVNKEKYQPGTSIRAWLFTIMRNIFINDYRRNGRKKIVMDTVKYFESVHPPTNTNSAILKEIHLAIYSLPIIFKTASLLYFQGYKYQEIAEVLNEPLGTIKSRIHFARKLLQKKLTVE
jgi:RNA polymerase sigma factor (sigma-70 family)